ncbi:MAG: hypothetical protein GXO56_03040 [Chloroflexi bacterium]|nr:hypothetical protein [Chloroflexota bacterium]
MQMDAETRTRRWSALQDKAAEIQTAAALGHAADALEDMDAKVNALTDKVRQLRAQGYRYAKVLDAQVAQIAQDWPTTRRQAQDVLTQRRGDLRDLNASLSRILAQGQRATTEAEMDAAKDALDRLEDRIDQAERDVEGAFDGFSKRVDKTAHEIEHLLWASDQWAKISFDPYPEEALVDACEAQWLIRDDEGPKGVLFLTDARLIMEQKEKIATKKVLFIATEKKLVQNLQFAAPIGAVEVQESVDARGGFLGLGTRELLTLKFTAATEGKRISQAKLRLFHGADNDQWAARIKQVQRGDLTQEAIDAQADGKTTEETSPHDIPTHCPACGALFTQPVVKGMRELRCEYCGAVVRL